jgi:hypothetical protein
MEGTGAVINFEHGKTSLSDVTATPRASAERSNMPAVLTVISGGKERRSPQPNRRETQQAEERLLASTARALAEVEESACQSLELPSRYSSKVTGSRNSACLMLANSSGQELALPKATVLGVAEPLIDRINARNESSTKKPTGEKKKQGSVRQEARV